MNPYIQACRALGQARVRYLIVGVFGINLYAEEAAEVMTTADCDLLLLADAAVLSKAIKTLRRLGFEIEAEREPLVDEDAEVIGNIVRARANVRAHRRGTQIDLPLEIAGCSFESMWNRRRRLRVEGVPVHAAPLTDLVRSKELANRPKDRLFLETFRSTLKEMLGQERRRPKPRG